MSIKSILKSTVVALTIVSGGSLFAQGTPINAAAYDALVAQRGASYLLGAGELSDR